MSRGKVIKKVIGKMGGDAPTIPPAIVERAFSRGGLPPMGEDTVRSAIVRAMDMDKIRRAASGPARRGGAATGAALGLGMTGVGGGLMAYDAMKPKQRARR